MTTPQLVAIIVAVILVDGLVLFVLGYRSGKRFAEVMAVRELRAMRLDRPEPARPRRPAADRKVAVFPSPAARVVGAIRGRPADWVQADLDAERDELLARPLEEAKP